MAKSKVTRINSPRKANSRLLFPEGIIKGGVPVATTFFKAMRTADLSLQASRLMLLLIATEHVECVRRKSYAYYAWELKIAQEKVAGLLNELEAAGFVRRVDEFAVMLAPGLFPCLLVGDQKRAERRWFKLVNDDGQRRA